MKYIVTHGDREIELELEPRDDGRYGVTIGDREFVADLRSGGGRSLHSLILGTDAYEVSVITGDEESRVALRGHALDLRVESEQERNARLVDAASGGSGPQTIKSVMPGRVVKVLVAVGDEVEAGQSLLILEAMKMENEIRARSAGTVTELLVAEGATVGNGEALVKIG